MENNQNEFEIENTIENSEQIEESTQEEPIQEEPIQEESTQEEPQTEENEQVVQKKKKRKKGRRRKKVFIRSAVWVAVVFALSLILALTVIISASEYFGMGLGRGRDVVVEIKAGMGTGQISHQLKEAGAINYAFGFRVFSKLKGFDGKYSYGVYSFNNEISYQELAEMLMKQGAQDDSVLVTIPEMSTIDEMAEILEKAGVCTAKDFKNEVNFGEFDHDFIAQIPEKMVHYRFEGYLFPDTYYFYCYDSKECAKLAVKKMLDKTEEVFDKAKNTRLEKMGYSMHQILTMSSIIELEAGGSPDEMANVAQVFYNRLNSNEFSTLGSLPTRKYPYGNGAYDTYICKGLPIGPLCAPSLKAIEAALYPNEQLDATYFQTDKSMNFYYNTSLAAHDATRARLQSENNWVYED